MSRLIIKNLPKNITEEKIREIFCQKGTITDVQLKYTPEGKFRQFGFIGYQNENEAEEAIKSFNQMFIKTSKIVVEKCALLGDVNKPKAWSKYAVDSTAYKKLHKTEKSVQKVDEETEKPDECLTLLKKYKDDPLFEEYLQVNAPKAHQQLQNLDEPKRKEEDSVEGTSNIIEEEQTSDYESVEENKLANQKISDLDYMKNLLGKSNEGDRKPRQKTEKKVKEKIILFTVKLRDLPYNCKKKDIKLFFKPNVPYSIRVPRQIRGIAYAGFKTEKNMKKALMKDKSFINGKQVSVMKYSTENDNNEKDDEQKNNDPQKRKWQNQEEMLKNEEDIAESGRIFIRNLSYTTTEEDIEKMFSAFGLLSEINLPVDTITRKMKGFGVVTFVIPEHAVKAYSALDGTVLHGRMLHLLPGKSKDASTDQIEESTNYKLKKSAQQKSQAGSAHNWNSLFLGHDAVAEVIADTYSTTKEAVVGPDGKGSAAVRLALGETQIVAQTRKYLEQEGVLLDSFNTTSNKRSKTTILVKNLPSKTEIKELRVLFEKHGEISRIILPPSGITAIIEFFEPSEARKAFTRLAYSRFKNVPLYLEWAPENSLNDNRSQENIKNSKDNKETSENVSNKEETNEEKIVEEVEDDEEPEPDTTLFVKNLNFKTSDEDLQNHFKSCGKIHYANVATKRDKSNSNNKLSMGYGFVRFKYKADADKALKTLQQSVLDGKSLELKRSERTLQNEVVNSRKTAKKVKQTGTKILVRNVPFQAKKAEIQELFSTFGEIKALRLPKKMAIGCDSHRGFAFVDFTTASDAKTAFEALSQSTHLYGRRLVLEWASTEEGVDEIRKRTADHFGQPDEVRKNKKSVFNLE